MSREVILVGDKVLIKPEEESGKTASGLYLPAGVSEKEAVASGHVVNVGPGSATGDTADSESWSGSSARTDVRYLALQAKKGDLALFLRRNAVEVQIDDSPYLIVPHGAILLLIRDRIPLP